MDKQEVLKEYRKTEDRILLSQVLDKIEIAEKRNQIQYTDFLDMYQVALVKKFLNKNQLQNYILYGGFEDAERKIAIFYSDNYDKEIVEKDYQKMLKVIRVQLGKDEIGKYTHRNYLGGIIKLGMKREKVGDIIVVKEGEKVPLDGIIIEGNAMLDTSALTGESELLNATIGSEVLSGSINKSGLIEVKVTSVYKNSTVSRILSLVETATERKTKTETVVSKYAPVYTLSVLIVAILVGALLPLITNLTYTESIYKALTIIVVSCPCAVAISVPLAYFSGIGASSKEGILIKGSNYLDSIKNIKKVVFDKTGTITTGEFYVSKINIYDKKYTKDKVLELCAKGESLSNHPIAASIIKEYGKEVSTEDIKEHREYQGKGITYNYKDQNIKIGNSKFCNQKETKNIYLMINDNLVAELEIKDKIKESAKETIKILKDMNIETYMFTGDNKEKAIEIAKKVGIKNVFYEMLPNDKYQKLEELINTKKEKELVSFVGDGINDAPVLALSDIGISMGSLGSDSAIEASDVVIMNDNLSKIITAIKISQKTNKIIKENLIFAITIKLLVLILTILGLSTMWEAVFADVGVTVLCILNTLRLLKNNQL